MQLAKEAGLEVKRGIVVDDHHAHQRSRHLRRRRVRRASRPVLRPGGAALRDGEHARPRTLAGDAVAGFKSARARRPSSRSPASTSSPPATSPKATDRRRSCCAMPSRGVYKRAGAARQPHRRRGAVRRYRRTARGIFDLLKQRHRRRRHARDADLRPGLSGRRRPARSGGRRSRPCPTMPRSAAATASARARSRSAIAGHGPDDARRRAGAHQGVGVVRPVHRPRSSSC